MQYTLHQLRLFHQVVRSGSITRAAEELHLTQPAVSAQLKKLQDQFDIPLTETIGNELYITDFGKELAAIAERVLEEVGNIDQRAQAHLGYLAGKLTISSVSTGKYVMPYLLGDFLKRHPRIDLEMDVTNRQTVLGHLERNEVDFALVSVLPEGLRVKREELLPNTINLVKAKGVDLGEREREEIPLILREKGSATRKATEEYLATHSTRMKKQLELTSNEAVKQAVMAGLGYSIMPLIGIRNEIEQGFLEVVPAPGLPVETHWNLIWLAEKKLSPVAEAYLAYIREEKQRLIDALLPQGSSLS
jgi:DNA-binding transcriptional LysR family regulator